MFHVIRFLIAYRVRLGNFTIMGALLSVPFFAVPSITGIGGWILSCCGAAAVASVSLFADNSALLSANLAGHVHRASPLGWLMPCSSSSTRWWCLMF